MTTTAKKTKGYIITGKVLEVSDTVRKDGKTPSKKVRIERIFKGALHQITATINPGKPLAALADKLVVGADFKAFGYFEQLQPQGEYTRGAQVFRAIGLPMTREERMAAAA